MNAVVDINVDHLAARLESMKGLEDAARKTRIELEQEIVSILGAKEEGSSTFSGAKYQLTTTGSMTRTIDQAAVIDLQNVIPHAIFERLFPAKRALNMREYRYIEANEPELFRAACSAVTTKPAKTSVKLKEITE